MAKFTKSGKFKFETLKFDQPIRQFRSFHTKERLSTWSESAIKDKLILACIFIWFFLLITNAVFVFLNLKNIPNLIPLFYSRAWGDLQLARKEFIFIPLIGAVIIGLANFTLAVSLHKTDKVNSYILSSTASLLAILATYTCYNIIVLVR